jgi:hypothetical protein
MSLLEPPPLRPGDDLDGLLRAYFRKEMPSPWPAPKLPPVRTLPFSRPGTARRPLVGSRLALAAAVALLLLGSLLLPGKFFPTGADAISPRDFKAERMRPGQDLRQGPPVAPKAAEKPERDPLDFELPPMK